jgi:hypothetical protein
VATRRWPTRVERGADECSSGSRQTGVEEAQSFAMVTKTRHHLIECSDPNMCNVLLTCLTLLRADVIKERIAAAKKKKDASAGLL